MLREGDSAIKPQGILMTPGTARARKSVSFGGGTKKANEKKPISKSGIPDDCPGKFPSPWVPKVPSKLREEVTPSKPTSVTKSMERVRDIGRRVENRNAPTKQPDTSEVGDFVERLDKDIDTKEDFNTDDYDLEDTPVAVRQLEVQAGLTSPQLRAENQIVMQGHTSKSIPKLDLNGDHTVDFNEPHSNSGRYWKSEYESYHRDAKAQLRKLVKYKQLAKSHATKKENEAADLAAKLKEEQRRVEEMEEKLADLAALAANGNFEGDSDSASLMRDLARQTALAVQYKSQVEKFKVALEEREKADRDDNRTTSREEQRKAGCVDVKDEDCGMSELRADMQSLRRNLSAAEKRASTLHEENTKLARELARTKEELAQSEERRQAAEARNDDSNKLLMELQKNYDHLKNAAKSQRLDAQSLLSKRHEQVAGLKKEILNLKKAAAADGSSTRAAEDPAFTGTRNKRRSMITEVEVHEKKPAERSTRHRSRTRPAISEFRRVAESRTEQQGYEDKKEHKDTGNRIPARDRSLVRPGRSRINIDTNSDEPRRERPKSLTTALTEIANVKTGISEESKRYTADVGLRERFATLNNDLAKAEARLSESRRPTDANRESTRRMEGSPRPSMYNLTADNDRPRPATLRYTDTDSADRRMSLAPERSRLDSMASTGSRSNLDPERHAAAKARLERRNAEKARLDATARLQRVRV